MLRKITFLIVSIFILSLIINPVSHANSSDTTDFIDVPKDHWAYEAVHRLRDLKITYGIGGNRFGLGKTITRGEFLAFLVRLMGWEIVKPEKGSFLDNMDPNHHFYGTIETST